MSAPLATLPLFERFPSLAARVPWIPLADLPTPVQRLARWGGTAGLDDLWIKRDDLTGRLYGGNKVRALEFALAEARGKKKPASWPSGPWGPTGPSPWPSTATR